MDRERCDLGMIGLGVMGRNLLLNMADHNFVVAGYDRDPNQVDALRAEAEGRNIEAAASIKELVDVLRRPRTVMLLIPAGPPVDAVIEALLPYLEPDDLIIDGGNSHFQDTNRREKILAEKEIHFLGVGISGGESGARAGPSLMPGGQENAYERVQPLFETIAAKATAQPCVAYLGPHSAGHYVKMVHNGIEYALMQLIAESYDLMKRGLGLNGKALYTVFEQWNQSELNSYLVETTAHVLRWIDDRTGKRLVDVILDEAAQKGTGIWTSQDAMDLQVPTPTIAAAVAARDLSGYKNERVAASKVLKGPAPEFQGQREPVIAQLHQALYAGTIITYAQGMSQLRAASRKYGYQLKLESIAGIWRGGCIIRAALLEDIRDAYIAQPELPNLLMDSLLSQRVMERQSQLRAVVQRAVEWGIPVPGLMSTLAYYDGYRSAWLPANLIQAQRDYFGAHTYERVDQGGDFHTQWSLE